MTHIYNTLSDLEALIPIRPKDTGLSVEIYLQEEVNDCQPVLYVQNGKDSDLAIAYTIDQLSQPMLNDNGINLNKEEQQGITIFIKDNLPELTLYANGFLDFPTIYQHIRGKYNRNAYGKLFTAYGKINYDCGYYNFNEA